MSQFSTAFLTSRFSSALYTPKWYKKAVRWVEYKKVTAEPMVTKGFRLDQAKEAFEAFQAGDAAKVLFEM